MLTKVHKFIPYSISKQLSDRQLALLDSKLKQKFIEANSDFSFVEENAVAVKLLSNFVREDIEVKDGVRTLYFFWGGETLLIRNNIDKDLHRKIYINSRDDFSVVYLCFDEYLEVINSIPVLDKYFNRMLYHTLHLSRDCAAQRTSVPKDVQLKLTIAIFYSISKHRNRKFNLSIEDFCDLTQSSRQYLWRILKPHVNDGHLKIGKNSIEILNIDGLVDSNIRSLMSDLREQYLSKWQDEFI